MSNEERMAIALERIADALEKQNAGNQLDTSVIKARLEKELQVLQLSNWPKTSCSE